MLDKEIASLGLLLTVIPITKKTPTQKTTRMDIDALLKLIQDWTNRIPLIILGSGASVPFRLPSMQSLGEHLKNNISFSDPEDISQFEDFKSILDKGNDLETTLLQVQLTVNFALFVFCITLLISRTKIV